MDWSVPVALGCLALWLVREASGRSGRGPLYAAMLALAVVLAWRGVQIRFLPLTNKVEAFLSFALALLGVLVVRHPALGRPGRILLGTVATVFVATTLHWDGALHQPSPLLVTVWYALHVPLTFVAYGLWLAAAADGLDFATGAADAAQFRHRQESDVRWGLVAFSLAMVFGSIWGVVSWGAYFLWDAKILWSLAAWVYFATFAHVRYWPLPGGKARVALGAIGFFLVLGTYVGTSFMKGSIHAF